MQEPIAPTDELGLSGLRSSLGLIRKQYATAVDALEALKRKREEIQAAPIPKADMIEAAYTVVDGVSAKYQASLMRAMESASSSHEAKPFDDRLNAAFIAALFSFGYRTVQDAPAGVVIANSMVLLFGAEKVKSALRREIESLDILEGLPMADRPAKLAKLDEKISRAEASITELRRSVTDAGIALDPTDNQSSDRGARVTYLTSDTGY